MRRHLVRLLALLLAPLLVVTLPSVARAVTGAVAEASFTASSGGPLGGTVGSLVTCEVQAYFEGGGGYAPVMHGSINCAEGYNTSNAMIGFSASSPGCSYSYAEEQHDGYGSRTFVLSSTTGYVADACNITELCWTSSLRYHSNPFNWEHYEGCVPFALGGSPQEESGSTCDYVSPSRPTIASSQVASQGSGYATRRDITFQLNAGNMSNAGSQYTWYTVLRRRTGVAAGTNSWTGVVTVTGLSSDLMVRPFNYALSVPGSRTEPWRTGDQFGTQAATVETHEIIGVGLIRNPSAHPVTAAAANVTTDPNGTGTGLVGRNTSGTTCSFYWGEKIVTRAGDSSDDPRFMTEPPAPTVNPTPDNPDGAGCSGFSFTDPSTWASAGVCAIVRVLQWIGALLQDIWSVISSVLDAILGLPAQIIAAILDGLSTLFIPADGYLDGKVTDLRGDFRDTSVGSYTDTLTGQDFNLSSSGCSGVPVDWSLYGESFSFNLLGACSGVMANVAAIVKLCASAILVVFGGLACVRSIGSGFGWSPTIPGRAADA